MELPKAIVREMIVTEILTESAVDLFKSRLRCEAALVETGCTSEEAQDLVGRHLALVAQAWDEKIKARGITATAKVKVLKGRVDLETYINGKNEEPHEPSNHL